MTVALIANLLLASIGLIVLVLGLLVLRGRPVATPHCPTCWYDLANTPDNDGITCPECGRTAESVSELHPRRRRWRAFSAFAVLTLMLMAAPWFFGLGGRVYPWLPDPVLAFAYAHGDDARARTILATRMGGYGSLYRGLFTTSVDESLGRAALRRLEGYPRTPIEHVDTTILQRAIGMTSSPGYSTHLSTAADKDFVARVAAAARKLIDHPDPSVRQDATWLVVDHYAPESTIGFALEAAADNDPARQEFGRAALDRHMLWGATFRPPWDGLVAEAYLAQLADRGRRSEIESGIRTQISRGSPTPAFIETLRTLEMTYDDFPQDRAEWMVQLLRGQDLEDFTRERLLFGDDRERMTLIRELEDLWRDDPARAERALPGVFAYLHQQNADIRRWFNDAEDFEPHGWAIQLGGPP